MPKVYQMKMQKGAASVRIGCIAEPVWLTWIDWAHWARPKD